MRKRPPRREARGGADVYHFFGAARTVIPICKDTLGGIIL